MTVIATPLTHPPYAESPTVLATHAPAITNIFGEAVTIRRRAFLTQCSAIVTAQLPILDASGNLLDISTASTVQARIREAVGRGHTIHVADGSIVNGTDSTVQFTMPTSVMAKAGIYTVEVGVLDGDESLLRSNTVFLYNEFSAWASTTRHGPPALDDIRLSLRDSDPIENELISNHDTDLAEICASAVRAVEFWNDTPPIVGRMSYSTINFPFREIWLTGIQLFLFQMLEEHYRRNVFPYSAGGVTTDDKNRHKEYNAAWTTRMQQYRSMVMHQKARINLAGAFGSFLAGYPG
jgi:hypothetical protein